MIWVGFICSFLWVPFFEPLEESSRLLRGHWFLSCLLIMRVSVLHTPVPAVPVVKLISLWNSPSCCFQPKQRAVSSGKYLYHFQNRAPAATLEVPMELVVMVCKMCPWYPWVWLQWHSGEEAHTTGGNIQHFEVFWGGGVCWNDHLKSQIAAYD